MTRNYGSRQLSVWKQLEVNTCKDDQWFIFSIFTLHDDLRCGKSDGLIIFFCNTIKRCFTHFNTSLRIFQTFFYTECTPYVKRRPFSRRPNARFPSGPERRGVPCMVRLKRKSLNMRGWGGVPVWWGVGDRETGPGLGKGRGSQSEQVWTGPVSGQIWTPPEQTDRREWKHYLPATSLVGGKK